jgi:hypothetical protein
MISKAEGYSFFILPPFFYFLVGADRKSETSFRKD